MFRIALLGPALAGFLHARRGFGRRALSLLATLALSVALGAAPVKFDLPAQPLPAALMAVARQADVQVLFPHHELKELKAPALSGDFEVAEALARLLVGTGYIAVPQGAKQFLVRKVTAGSVHGALRWPDGGAAARVSVSLRGTGLAVETNREGEYFFPQVPAGTYVLIAQAEGYQPLHLTAVTVRAGQELTLSPQTMRKSTELTRLDPFVVSAESVTKLGQFEVSDRKSTPFADGNLDLPRSINDAQPYYIFEAKTIDQSGAANVEDFLKQQLTMNTVAQTNSETSGLNTLGNTSSINLRGVGTDKTLVLVNGRRMAGVNIGITDYQPDLNGIPLNAIERIEVLPSSASGIYGGSAIGGVVNVILKQNYTGGELRLSYDSYWGTGAGKKSVSLNYGKSLEGGKTHVTLNASWTDTNPLLLQDSAEVFLHNLNAIIANYPAYIYGSTTPWLGSLPNIIPNSSSVTTLTLKGGTALNSRMTYVPAGTSSGTTTTDLAAGLLANAGKWNTDLPISTQYPSGLLRRIGNPTTTRYFQTGIQRQMLPGLLLTGDFIYSENQTDSVYNPTTSYLTVPAAASTNPFTTDVRVRVPDAASVPMTTRSQNRSATLGAVVKLPWAWTGSLDYSWSENRYDYLYYSVDTTARTADLQSGALNPFVDTLLHPLNLSKYLLPYSYRGSTQLHDLALRGSGPLPALPWGQPTLTVGLERRLARTPERTTTINYPVTVASSYRTKYYARESTTDSAYAEMTLPLVKTAWLPGLHALDLQLSGRTERYEVDTGTDSESTYFNRAPATVTYSGTTLNGAPYFSKASYASNNYTVGLKYQPVKELTLRVSRATAFLPPTPTQLIKDPAQSATTTSVLDPVTKLTTNVYTLTGGNPDLKPQHSKSLNAGLIWEPSWRPLRGLRLNAEYYKIEQFDAIGTLGAQAIVNQESLYPDRVTRDSSGTITLVDNSMVSLFHRETEGWDLSVAYNLQTPVGTFRLNAVQTTILHLKTQYSQTQAEYDAVNFPSEDGAAKYKSNLTLSWERSGWTAGWTARYFGSYKQYGAASGPYSMQYLDGGVESTNTYILAGGGDTIPSQTYHDAFVGYTFREAKSGGDSKSRSLAASLLSGLSLQLNVRNVFDKAAPLDPYYAPYYLSPYGGGLGGMRSYWITLKKTF